MAAPDTSTASIRLPIRGTSNSRKTLPSISRSAFFSTRNLARATRLAAMARPRMRFSPSALRGWILECRERNPSPRRRSRRLGRRGVPSLVLLGRIPELVLNSTLASRGGGITGPGLDGDVRRVRTEMSRKITSGANRVAAVSAAAPSCTSRELQSNRKTQKTPTNASIPACRYAPSVPTRAKQIVCTPGARLGALRNVNCLRTRLSGPSGWVRT